MGDRAGWSDYIAADTFIASSDLNALASGTAAANYKLGAAIDNRASAGHGYEYGDLEIVFRDGTPADTTVTTTGTPYVDIYLLPSPDGGTRYPTTNGGSTAGPTQIGLRARRWMLPVGAIGIIIIPRLVLPAGFFKGMINWVGGVSFPSNNNCLCRLYRHSERGNLT